MLLSLVLEDNPIPRVVIHNTSFLSRIQNALLEITSDNIVIPLVKVDVRGIIWLAITASLRHKIDTIYFTNSHIFNDIENSAAGIVSVDVGNIETNILDSGHS
jgi:hypothetical protein